MTWEWSHTNEGYDNVRANIRDLSVEDLRVCYAEIVTYELCLQIENLIREAEGEELILYPSCPDDYFNSDIYNRIFNSEVLNEMCEAHENSSEEFTELSEFVWLYASEGLRECTNGGIWRI